MGRAGGAVNRAAAWVLGPCIGLPSQASAYAAYPHVALSLACFVQPLPGAQTHVHVQNHCSLHALILH